MLVANRNKVELMKIKTLLYVEKLLMKFEMGTSKPVTTPLVQQFKLSNSYVPKTKDEEEYMKKVPFSNVVSCLMYLMVCTRLDLGHGACI